MAASTAPLAEQGGIAGWFARRASEALGALLILAALAMALALLGHNPNDPSLNHATVGPVTNPLGYVGASIADLGLQMFGYAVWVPVIVLPAWGLRLILGAPFDLSWMRLVALPPAILASAGWLATFAVPTSWPYWLGLGGSVGDVLLHHLQWLLGPASYAPVTLAAGAGQPRLCAVVRAVAALQGGGGRAAPPALRRAGGRAAALGRGGRSASRRSPQRPPGAAAPAPAGRELRLRARHRRLPRRGPAPGRAAVSPGAERRSRRGRGAAGDAAPARDARRAPGGGARAAAGRSTRRDHGQAGAGCREAGRRRRACGRCPVQAAAFALPRRAAHARQDRDRSGDAHRDRAGAREGARRFRRARRDRRRPPRPGGDAVRARAGARHARGPRDQPGRRHRPLAVRDVGARRGGAGAQRDRHRAAQRAARDRLPARSLVRPGLRGHLGHAHPGARQGHRRRADRGRPLAHAASSDRGHHRLGQVGRDQRHDPLAALPAAAGPVQADHDRSQGDRAVGLRRHPASAGAGGDGAAEGGGRAEVGRARDGRPLPADVAPGRARHRRLQPPHRRCHGARRAAVAPGADRLRARHRRADLRAAADPDDASAADRGGGRRGRGPDADRRQGDRIRRSSGSRKRRAPPAST